MLCIFDDHVDRVGDSLVCPYKILNQSHLGMSLETGHLGAWLNYWFCLCLLAGRYDVHWFPFLCEHTLFECCCGHNRMQCDHGWPRQNFAPITPWDECETTMLVHGQCVCGCWQEETRCSERKAVGVPCQISTKVATEDETDLHHHVTTQP